MPICHINDGVGLEVFEVFWLNGSRQQCLRNPWRTYARVPGCVIFCFEANINLVSVLLDMLTRKALCCSRCKADL